MTGFPSIRIEGGLFAPDILDQLMAGDLPGQKPSDFGIEGRRSLTDEIAGIFADARQQWEIFRRQLERLSEEDEATKKTRNLWVIPFLSLLGYELTYNTRAYEVEGVQFAISHRAGINEDAPPVHIVGARQELGRLDPKSRPRMAPHVLLQEFLNRTEHLWGIVTNGRTLRLLRDSTYIRRQAYVEFDLEGLFEEQRFQDFVVLYRLLHRTRLPVGVGDARACLLEQYYQLGLEQGGRVRERLREGVEACLQYLANGFLAHPANTELRTHIARASPQFSPEDFYRQLLRLVYRFLFLLVSEERGLISGEPLYQGHYGVGRLRRLASQRSAYTEHEDLWCSLRVLWKVLSDEKLAPLLGAAPLNGELFAPMELDRYSLTNRDLLQAFWHLSYYRESRSAAPRRINYAALDVEELGSVYESLLDYRPHIDRSGGVPRFELASGSERKATGSYYTPAELVAELIHSALEPVIEERLRGASTPEQKAQAILSIRVLDPACGSGHFLLAAARRLGKALAKARQPDTEPAPEALRHAIRDVVAHCIYGVDKNPLAVELCRVALWLESHAQGMPLSFLDHRIRCGDSLVGLLDLSPLHTGIPDAAFDPVANDDKIVAKSLRHRNHHERHKQLEIFTQPLDPQSLHTLLTRDAKEILALEQIPDDSLSEIAQKKRRFEALQRQQAPYRQAAHIWTAAFFQPMNKEALDKNKALTTALVWKALLDQPDPQPAAVARTLAERLHFFHWYLEFPEVFLHGGFDVVMGNPPFMGGLKISTHLGPRYRHWLQVIYEPFGGTADLCAAFYRRAYALLRPGGRMGMIATNTIGQGDTRESGLLPIIRGGGIITFARRFIKWPGTANVEVNLIAIRKPDSPSFTLHDPPILDGQPVSFISSRLDPQPEGEPKRLSQNEGRAFQGDIVRGIGFVLESTEAEGLLAKDPRNADCLFPYLNGEDLNSHPEQKPSRWVICFHDWELERAKQYPDLLRIVEERVRPERERLRGPGDVRNREFWWQFGAYRTGMRRAISPLKRVLVRALTSEMHMMSFVPKGWIYSHAIGVFAFDDDYHFALLQSSVHEVWVWRQASSLESRNRYTPTDCFDTFPFPERAYELRSDLGRLLTLSEFAEADRIGAEYHEHRRNIMLTRKLGLTKTYNLFHDSNCHDTDITRLRELHAAMDCAILACYGWSDINLQHGFYLNDRGQTRFTVSPEARRKLLIRLLELNEQIAGK